ncbi:thiolase family protein [Pollutimonas sp. H1-120]|uniref:thiolase family protein n=1 Tax=Pollutimonas sp. H1-120 TaxID=3148824 RepID=UPI003B51DBB7
MIGMFEGVRIVGAGQAAYAKKSDRSLQRLMYEAGTAALTSAGLPWRAVDGLAVTCFGLPPDNVPTVAEHFGLETRFMFQGVYGGASGIIGMSHAARAIRDGACDVALVVAADSFDVAAHNKTLDHFNGSVKEWMSPQGFAGANGMFALHTQLYMERHGARREDFGKFCIALRENGLLNSNALFKQPLTMAAYLSAKPIASPLCLFDCVMPCIGGDAIVLASEKTAARLNRPSVRILAAEEIHNYPANDIYQVPGGWQRLADRLYDNAGFVPAQMDFAQLYDDYPVMAFVQLEGLGLCPSGRAAEFLRQTDITTQGAFPINTGGGQLSAGQAGASGGMIGVYEAVAQLLGEAGRRQIPCKRGIVSGYGMVAYGRGLSSSAAILERAD